MSDPIKRGDTPTLTWTLDPAPSPSATCKVIISAGQGFTPIVSRPGVLDGSAVSITLTADETAIPGAYLVEVEVTNGDTIATWPSAGYDALQIQPDLG